MDTLPKGITGFWDYYKSSFFGQLFKIKEKPIPQVDVHGIKKSLHN